MPTPQTSTDTMEPRPMGVVMEIDEGQRLRWAIDDRLRARAQGNGVFRQMSRESFKRCIDLFVDEYLDYCEVGR